MAQQSNSHQEYGRTEQIISQFFLKSLHIILDSRIPSLRPHDRSGNLSSGSHVRKNDKWFNLALGDRPAALENLNFWQRNIMHPMVIDVILNHEGSSLGTSAVDDLHMSSREMVETVIERWVVQYSSLRTTTSQPGENPSAYRKMYKKLLILLRGLYSTLRLLPAFRTFRQLTSSSQTYNFDLSYKVSSFSKPFSGAEAEEMKQYEFVPVETPFGGVCISATYRRTLSDFNLEASTSLPPQIITDYVGSPATDPLKVFCSMDKGKCATSFPSRGFHSPTSASFQRPNSWTSGIHRAGPSTQQHFGASPPPYDASPMFSDFHSSPPVPYGRNIPSYRPLTHGKGVNFDEHGLSPPFSPSPSPSPSPPAYISSGSPLQPRRCSESAPVNIPLPMTGKSHRYLTPNSSDPNRQFLPPMSPRSTKGDLSSQESPSEGRSFRKQDRLRTEETYSGSPNLHACSGPKAIKDGRDDSGRFSGLISCTGSPQIGFSRSFSRLSFQDELDDCDFSCPFAVDDVDTSGSQARTPDGKDGPESTQMFPVTRKSQDAAVGILVHMLRTAPPLRQDCSYMSQAQASKSELDGEVTASGFFIPRKTSDAIEELRIYREMKNQLLSQSETQLLGSLKQRTK